MDTEKNTHSKAVAYCLWLFGFMGVYRFYFGKRMTGILWFCTLGLFGIGWFIDLFLIPSMQRKANLNYSKGKYNYSIAWLLLACAGFLGLHRFYLAKIGTGILYLLTLGCLGIGILYDLFYLNTQINNLNQKNLR